MVQLELGAQPSRSQPVGFCSCRLHYSCCRRRFQGALTSWLAFGFPPFAGGFEFAVACGEDFLLTAFEFVLRRDVDDGGVQPDCVVVFNELADNLLGLVEALRCERPHAIAL